jgi:prepilin-type N-terminal cleavage/methylation domain-containing protein
MSGKNSALSVLLRGKMMFSLRSYSGFSLVELIVVILIIGVLLSIGGINFRDWVQKSQIERQAREMLADLNSARSESIFRKKRHSIVMNSTATGYVLKRYSSENESRTTGGTVLSSKTNSYQYAKESGSSAADLIIQFDILGFAATPSDLNTLRVNPIYSGAAFDCLVISNSRTNIGKMESGSCVQK